MLQPTWCSPCLILGCGLPSMAAAVQASSFPFGPGHKVHAPVNHKVSLALPCSVTHPCSSPSLGKNLGFSIGTTQGPALGPFPEAPLPHHMLSGRRPSFFRLSGHTGHVAQVPSVLRSSAHPESSTTTLSRLSWTGTHQCLLTNFSSVIQESLLSIRCKSSTFGHSKAKH